MKSKDYIFTGIFIVIFILSFITELHRFLTFLLMANTMVVVLDKLGRGIVMRELMAFHSGFVCLLMPLIGYIFYTVDNPMALLWFRYMNVPEELYFRFSLPATTGFIIALCWPVASQTASDQGKYLQDIISNAKKTLEKIPSVGVIIMIIGIIVFGTSNLLPQSLQFAFLLFYFSAFGGFLYVYYQPRFKRKILILSLFGVFIIAQSLVSGMFTIVAYMGITLFSFFFLGKKTSFIKKLSFFILGISLLFIIQSVKMSYRKEAWNKEFEGNRIELFGKLIKERFSSNDQTTLSDLFFPIYYRANQGFNIGLVMNRIPKYQDFDRGSNLGTIIISSFVPRVFWPNKPEAGGKGNMSHYTGYNIEGWSTNVGPLGEAYGSFGVNGGVIYMILLGAFIRWGYRKIFIFSQKLPLVLFWIPVVFYQVTYAAEADTLQVINSMVKSAFFVWIVYKLIPKWFGITKSAIEGPSKEHSATLISTHNT